MKLKFEKLNKRAVTPTKGTEFSAGWDLTATWKKETHKYIEYGTDIALEIPKGKVGLLFARSSVTKLDLMLKNAVGVIDSDYRGEIKFRFFDTSADGNNDEDFNSDYDVGERIGQIIFIDYDDEIEMIEADELEDTVRGTGGYGHTDKLVGKLEEIKKGHLKNGKK